MEHEVFVPVETEPLRQALGDAARVARGIQGLQRDANEGAEPVSGRLKVRIAGHTITYRGALRVTEDTSAADPSFTVTGEATEVRGAGSVELSLGVRLLTAEGGTRLVYSGTGKGDGRVAELETSAVEAAVRRLLNRFSQGLAATVESGAVDEVEAADEAEVADRADQADQADQGDEDGTAPPSAPEPAASEPSAPETSVPDPFHQDAGDESFIAPPAEAAHARRTMIGRSAEEVDHAPPRGRYAPVPAPQAATAGDTLRWAAPAAALVVASAIVVGRVLRRRR